ncbi:MAG: DUF6786 family protein [Bacteroidales bacterium]
MKRTVFLTIVAILFLTSHSCNQNNKRYDMGKYGYDKAFFEKHRIDFLELESEDGLSRILVVPAYQGRVMTSTAKGNKGNSYGWINYSFIEAGQQDPQFNVFGGEERLWLGPEGGPYSIYFGEGEEQVFENWVVPSLIDTDTFDILEQDSRSVRFSKSAVLKNVAGSEFSLSLERKLSVMAKEEVSEMLNIPVPDNIRMVAYESENTIMNRGSEAWTKEGGLLSLWMLCMFNPSPETTVFLPYREDTDGVIVNDDYFGKVPSDRLKVENGTVFFKIDGKHRSKIGIPPQRAKALCGSYDSGSKVLTLLWSSLPDEPMPYVNSKWGIQDDPYVGDAVNSYNDGPVDDGSIMGPFYEIETSSPAAALKPGESLVHVQRVMHFEAEEAILAAMVDTLFDLDLKEIANKFK